MKIKPDGQILLKKIQPKQNYIQLNKAKKSKNDDDNLRKAAQQFEAIFISQFLKNTRRSISESSMFGSGISGDIYKSMFDDQISNAVASKGGFHLSDIIIKSFKPKEPAPQAESDFNLSDYRLRRIKQVTRNRSDEKWDRSIITEAANKYGVDPKLVEAIIKTESNFKPNIVSKKGAAGLMQLLKTTAQNLGVKNRFDPKQNIFGGVKYFKEMLDRFQGDLKLALSAYNAGPEAVEKYNGIPPYKETQNYVSKVLSYYREL